MGIESGKPDWNVLAVSYEREERKLLEELKELGYFEKTEFRSLLVGKVLDDERFLEELNQRMPFALSWVVPIEETFFVSPDNIVECLKRKIERYVPMIAEGDTFSIKFERRGFKGVISSKDVERELGSYLGEKLRQAGKSPKVSLTDPDKLITIQLIGNLCGIGLITRALREKCSFVKVK